jgi:broad specificity phosphatase PhoE
MTARVLLVRHASHDLLGRVLCGRQQGVGLSHAGLADAERLGELLCHEHPDAVYTSPQQRAQQTASPIAQACGHLPQNIDALDEIDFGIWTGRSFDQLAQDAAWQAWNADRLHHRPPAGESMLDVQARLAQWLEYVRIRHAGQTVVAISHADTIKALVCYVLGLSVDFYDRFAIDPASITALLAGASGLKLVYLNRTP